MRGVLISEGSSDTPLSGLIQQHMGEAGVTCTISSPTLPLVQSTKNTGIAAKLEALWSIDKQWPDILFVHRDVDNTSYQERLSEISVAVGSIDWSLAPITVPVLPVTMTEAWLLVSEDLIRQVASNPKGRVSLGLPKPSRVQHVRDPKAALKEAIATASEATGRRRKIVNRSFGRARANLFSRIEPVHLADVESWIVFTQDLSQVLRGEQVLPEQHGNP